MGSFDLHGLILYVSEGFLFLLLCIHNVGIKVTVGHHRVTIGQLRVGKGYLMDTVGQQG